MDIMRSQRQDIGGLGNLLFKEAYMYAQMRRGLIPDLFVQSEEYFEEFKDEIKQRFGSNMGNYDKRVALHVRRGDYVNNPFYVDLFADGYYERAMRHFNGSFLVFSDDMSWCKEQPIFRHCDFAEVGTDVDQLNWFAMCGDRIIANSSFSWWGAYLSPNKGLTIAPKKWHPDGICRTKLPAEWLQI